MTVEVIRERGVRGQLPAGGTTGQVPVKQSAADYDIAWADPSGGGGGPHAATHTEGGSDEITITPAQISGVLADGQIPAGIARDSEMTAAISAAISALVDAAPATLDTLNELAAALGDDPNFAATMAGELALKIDRSLFDANTILAANVDNTPVAVTVGEATLVGRLTGGVIAALSVLQVQTLLGVRPGTDVATQAAFDAHLTDTSDAHDASAISVAAGLFTATDVEAALAELRATRRAVADAATTITAQDRQVILTAITASRTWTLPAANAVPAGWYVDVLDASGSLSGSVTLTVQRAGSDTINGGTTVTLTSPHDGRRFVSDGSSSWVCVVPKALVDSTDLDWTVDEGADTVSGSVVGIRGHPVDATAFGPTDVDRTYVWDGDSFGRRGVSRLLEADVGAALVENTTAEFSLMASTFDIPAGSLRVGDVLEVWAFGTFVNPSGTGGTRTLRVFVEYDGIEAGSITSLAIASNTISAWQYVGRWQVTAIGASGQLTCYQSHLQVVNVLTGAALTQLLGNGETTTTIDTTQAITVDVRGQMSGTPHADLETNCSGVYVVKHTA